MDNYSFFTYSSWVCCSWVMKTICSISHATLFPTCQFTYIFASSLTPSPPSTLALAWPINWQLKRKEANNLNTKWKGKETTKQTKRNTGKWEGDDKKNVHSTKRKIRREKLHPSNEQNNPIKIETVDLAWTWINWNWISAASEIPTFRI